MYFNRTDKKTVFLFIFKIIVNKRSSKQTKCAFKLKVLWLNMFIKIQRRWRHNLKQMEKENIYFSSERINDGIIGHQTLT